MIKELNNFVICNFPGNHNTIYNKITSTVNGKSCYPDILLNHNLTELELLDNEAYETASCLIKKWGPSRCVFVSCDNSMLDGIISQLIRFYDSNINQLTSNVIQIIKDLASDLSLSVTMESAFINLMTYKHLQSDIVDYIATIRHRFDLPVKTKTQGKQIYELIRKDIIG